MKIGVICKHLSTTEPSGVEYFTHNILKEFIKFLPTSNFVLYIDKDPASWVNISGSNVEFRKVSGRSLSWTQVGLFSELIKSPVDILFAPYHTLPVLAPFFTKCVSFVHGLEYEGLKGNFIFNFLKGAHEWFLCLFSNVVLVPSQATLSDIYNKWPYLTFWPHKFFVVPESSHISPEILNISKVSEVKVKYNLERPYLMFTSSFEKRKNVESLVKAYESFGKNISWDLVLVGKTFGKVYPSVKVLGRVSDTDLACLYASAKGFVSASTKEGFGIHLLEAMSFGLPCAVSNIPAYVELGGDTVIYHDPFDIKSIAKNMHTLVSNQNEVLEMSVRAKEKAYEYSWEAAAQKILKTILE